MGNGASVGLPSTRVSPTQAAAYIQETPPGQVVTDLCTLITAAQSQGVDIKLVHSHIEKMLKSQLSSQTHPWEWSDTAAQALLENDFQKTEGFSHLEICIYKDNKIDDDTGTPFIDTRFEHELDALLSAFYRNQTKEQHPLEIIEVTAIHNENLQESMISSTLKVREQVALGGAYGAHWKTRCSSGGSPSPDEVASKQQVLESLGLSDPDSCIIGFAGQSNPQLCKNICSNGFADLAKTDPGYFGRGVYLSTHSEYAALYACSQWGWKDDEGEWRGVDIKGSINDIRAGEECTLLAAYATPGFCYPITRDVDYTNTFCWCDAKGQGMKFGYHSHGVLVNRLKVLREMNYQAMNVDANPSQAYGEIVVQQTGQTLPRYVIKCRRKDDSSGNLDRPSEPEIFPDLSEDIPALVQLFEDTNGVNWTKRTNWVHNSNLASWQGPHYPVGLDSAERVDRVRLPGNNVHGIFSDSIGTLKMLRILDLSDNKLRGRVPVSLGYLEHLEELYIDKNQLSGDLSIRFIWRKSLLGRRARIGEQASSVGGFLLPRNWEAGSDSCDSNALPAAIAEVKKLLLSNSSLSGLIPPPMLSYFSSSGELIELDLSKNLLTESIPIELGLIVSLQRVDFSNNKLEGCMPNEISLLCNLKDLILSRNTLSGGIPSFLGSMTALKNVDLSFNNFKGAIPDVFWDLTELLRLELGNNEFTEELPPSVSALNNLILFSCENNLLSGCVPTCYGHLAALRGLNLSSNKLTGSFPVSIAALTSLQRLNIANNEIKGTLPVFAAHNKLRVVDISHNLFSGSIPEEYKLLTALQTLFLNGNPELSVQGAANILSPGVELMT